MVHSAVAQPPARASTSVGQQPGPMPRCSAVRTSLQHRPAIPHSLPPLEKWSKKIKKIQIFVLFFNFFFGATSTDIRTCPLSMLGPDLRRDLRVDAGGCEGVDAIHYKKT